MLLPWAGIRFEGTDLDGGLSSCPAKYFTKGHYLHVDNGTVKQREKELRQACASLEQRLRAGENCRAENFFAAHPLLACQEDSALDLIYIEFITREELGQKPTPEEFYARFPLWRARLEQQFNIHEWLQEENPVSPQGSSSQASALPRRLGRYDLLEEIGRGRFGVVYKAWQHGLERLVAVKVPSPELNLVLPTATEFCHEARVMAALQHPHIMPVHEISEGDGLVFFSMNYAAGGSLAQVLAREGKLAPVRAISLLTSVADALHYAHQKGVIHRDVKPSNILMDEQGRPLVSDFGLARLPNKRADKIDPALGTPAYMAPEQIKTKNDQFTPAIDVWALGVVLYEALCGARPFDKKTRPALFRAIQRDPPPGLDRFVQDLDPRLEAICLKCLAKAPADRWSSAQELAQKLQDIIAR
jgi:hypothetical protein